MKRIFATLLVLVLILTSSCTQTIEKEEAQCSACDEMCSAYYYYCPNCGNRLGSKEYSEESVSIVPDFSNIGFDNNYGFDEWLQFDYCDFSDTNKAYVIVTRSHHDIISFENGYLQSREFSENEYYTSGFSKGSLCTAAIGYSIISNTLLNMSDGSTYEIEEISTKGNVPIIETRHTKAYNTQNSIEDGTFIPTYFLDFSRAPEQYEDSKNYIIYFIKPEYLEGYVIE